MLPHGNNSGVLNLNRNEDACRITYNCCKNWLQNKNQRPRNT